LENSPMLTIRGLDRVLGDLATLGYHARWCVLGADDANLDHKRKRIWILADTDEARVARSLQSFRSSSPLQPTGELRRLSCKVRMLDGLRRWDAQGRPDRYAESPLRRGDDGVASWDDRLKAIGNGQVPSVVVLAWNTLFGNIG
jgi:DNA (cytosine-5)-methyltransferase 1